jgi:hypothetical protein
VAWTYTTLKTAIESYLQNSETGFVDTYIDVAIKQAEDRISKSVILPANRKYQPLILTNGSTTANLPSDFLAPFELRISNSGEFTHVDYSDVSYMRSAFPNPLMVGVPRWYSMFDATTIILAPTPTTGLTGWLNYFHKPESIVTAGTSWLGSNAENCLLYGCLAEAYTFLKGDSDLMKLYEEKYQVALGDLKKLGEGMDMGDAYRMSERRVNA